MNIKDVAKQAKLPPKTIRYYEEIGLIAPKRDANGYRVFDEDDRHRLTFVGRARGLGFSIDECRMLLSLWADRDRASADVRALARDHLARIDVKIAELEDIRDTLDHLVQACAGDDRPDCPILTRLGASDTKS